MTRPEVDPAPVRCRLAVIGIGNTLAGDDGLGVRVVERLRPRWARREGLLLDTLEGDLLAVADLVPMAERFLFVDAVAGSTPGTLTVQGETARAFAPSFHQTDIGAVMGTLAALGLAVPFPSWELWGVVIDPPRELRESLSPRIAEALERLLPRLESRIEELIARVR